MTLTSWKAIEAVRAGNHISRTGWNGKGMYVYQKTYEGYKPVLVLVNPKGEHQPGWAFSQDDIFSDDWQSDGRSGI